MIKKNYYSKFMFVVSITILLYTLYRAEYVNSGHYSGYYLPYYIFSLTLLSLSILIRYLSKNISTIIIMSINTIILLAYSSEIYFSYNPNAYFTPIQGVLEFKTITAKKKNKSYKKLEGRNYDTRKKYDVYKELKKTNKNITLFVPPASHIYNTKINPLSGISNSETIVCNESGYFNRYKSDRFGFNNPDKEWDKKLVKYVLVGDSYIHGACVNPPNDISSVLRNFTNKKAVLNLGYSGNGPYIQYATLREYLDNNAEHILFFFYEGNDITDLEIQQNSVILTSYTSNLDYSQNLKKKQFQIDKVNKDMILSEEKQRLIEVNSKDRFNLFKIIKLSNLRTLLAIKKGKRAGAIQKNIDDLSFSSGKTLSYYYDILKLTKKLTTEKNATLHLVYLPSYPRYRITTGLGGNRGKLIHKKIKLMADLLDINFIDIKADVFDKEENPLKLFPFELWGHYNIEGYFKVATRLNEILKDYNK